MAIDLGFDESGAHDILLVIMQLAMVEQARKFKKKWKKMLLEADVPYFHAKEFGNYSHGVFTGLDRIDREALLRELARLARQHLTIGFTAKISKSAYQEKTTNEFRSKWGTAYTFAIQELIASAYIFCERFGLRPEFNVLVEDGHKNAGQAVVSLNDTKAAGLAFAIPSKLLSIGLGSKADSPILQAADMLSYSEWQRISAGDMTIYDRFSARGGTYQPEYVDFDRELVDVVVNSVNEWKAARKAWGQRNFKKVDDSDHGIPEIRPSDGGIAKSSPQQHQEGGPDERE